MLVRNGRGGRTLGLGCRGLALALVLSACGSTLQRDTTAGDSLPAQVGDELGLAEPDDAVTTGDAQVSERRGTTTRGPGRRAASRPGDSGVEEDPAQPEASTSVPPIGATGRGFTEKEIFIGYGVIEDVGGLYRGLGRSDDFGSQTKQAEAAAADINARGGIAGRQVRLIIHDYKTAQALSDPNRATQEACTHWTEDRPVFAAIDQVAGGEENLIACMAKRQTPVLGVAMGRLRPNRIDSKFVPYIYTPNLPSMDRLVPQWLQRAAANGYFKGWDASLGRAGAAPTKVGMLTSNPSYGDDFERIVRDQLARLDRPVAAAFQSSGDFSSHSSEMSQAVLQFRSKGVTHVIASDSAALLFFIGEAASQNYRPRYAITSYHHPKTLEQAVPATQLAGALGVGYTPTRDVWDARDPGDVSPAQARCREVMQQAGQDTSNRNAFQVMVGACDGFNFLAGAIESGGLSPEGLQRGAQAMGSLSPASTFGIAFPGGRPDGAAVVRDLGFREDCGCFAYLSDANHAM